MLALDQYIFFTRNEKFIIFIILNIFTIDFCSRRKDPLLFTFCKYVTHHIFCYNLFVFRYTRTRMILVVPTPLEHPSRVFSRKELVHLFLADVQGWGRSAVGECRII